MKIDVRTNKVVYITIGQWTYYIDDSTNEQIIKVYANRQIFNNHKSKSNDRADRNDKWNRI